MASPNDHNKKLSPRKGLQGPRPSPLEVGKSSSTIKKQPPVALDQARAPHPPPVIIYVKSPEVIHVDAQNFMSTVQHLTGSSSASSSLPLPSSSSGDGMDCSSKVGSSEKKGEEPAQISNFDVDHMLMQNMSSWGAPPSVPWMPPSSPTSLFPCPNAYPDFYDFDMISDTPNYQDSNPGSNP